MNKPRRILVVDDDRSIRELLEMRLAGAGYEVVLAEDAIVAGRILEGAGADLMIVDANMPYLSGVDFVANLVADPSLPWVPAIFITGREDLKEQAEKLGSACLVKPFLGNRLVELVERVLRSQDHAHSFGPGLPQPMPQASAA